MGWFDFEIPQFFIVENSKQSMNFNTGCVANVTFQKVGSNCGTFKQASETGLTNSIGFVVQKMLQ